MERCKRVGGTALGGGGVSAGHYVGDREERGERDPPGGASRGTRAMEAAPGSHPGRVRTEFTPGKGGPPCAHQAQGAVGYLQDQWGVTGGGHQPIRTQNTEP